MKRIVSAIIAIVMILSLSCAVFAAENKFVPSISEKGEPKLVGIELIKDGEVVGNIDASCLLLTAISRVAQSDAIPSEAASLLQKVFAELLAGTMILPAEENEDLVIRDLLDISLICEECAALLAQDGVSLKLTFDLGVAKEDVVKAMTYKNEKWNPVPTVNNGDGTVTCTFEHLCPVVFTISTMNDADDTGDAFRTELIFWTVAMLASAAALVVVISRRKAARA